MKMKFTREDVDAIFALLIDCKQINCSDKAHWLMFKYAMQKLIDKLQVKLIRAKPGKKFSMTLNESEVGALWHFCNHVHRQCVGTDHQRAVIISIIAKIEPSYS